MASSIVTPADEQRRGRLLIASLLAGLVLISVVFSDERRIFGDASGPLPQAFAALLPPPAPRTARGMAGDPAYRLAWGARIPRAAAGPAGAAAGNPTQPDITSGAGGLVPSFAPSGILPADGFAAADGAAAGPVSDGVGGRGGSGGGGSFFGGSAGGGGSVGGGGGGVVLPDDDGGTVPTPTPTPTPAPAPNPDGGTIAPPSSPGGTVTPVPGPDGGTTPAPQNPDPQGPTPNPQNPNPQDPVVPPDQPTPVSPVPEPATWALLSAGIGAVGAAMRRAGRRTARAGATG